MSLSVSGCPPRPCEPDPDPPGAGGHPAGTAVAPPGGSSWQQSGRLSVDPEISAGSGSEEIISGNSLCDYVRIQIKLQYQALVQ